MTTLRKGQVRLGPQTWAIIREAYLAGASGASLAETYGCSLGTIRYRAVREGWRRCDAETAVADRPAPAQVWSDAEPPTPDQLIDLAMVAAMRALVSGRPSEAAAYVRVAEAVRRMAGPESPASGACDLIPASEIEARREEFEERIQRIQATLTLKQGRAGLAAGRENRSNHGSPLQEFS